MTRNKCSDDQIVARARRAVAAKRRLRWGMLMYAVMFLGTCAYFTVAGIHRIQDLDAEQVTSGFVFGLGLAVVWVSFGVMGGLCLGKFLAGVESELRLQELLISYHDRLRELKQLPEATTVHDG